MVTACPASLPRYSRRTTICESSFDRRRDVEQVAGDHHDVDLVGLPQHPVELAEVVVEVGHQQRVAPGSLAADPGAADATILASYVPRLVREWLSSSDPGQLHRRITGSMVFVDISGFTKMSERLARLGKRGAEEVTSVISGCFDRLLADAYAAGGTLLKFGGDALLLLFRGDHHAEQAAAAALEMRATLRTIRVFETEAGRVRLGMTVGGPQRRLRLLPRRGVAPRADRRRPRRHRARRRGGRGHDGRGARQCRLCPAAAGRQRRRVRDRSPPPQGPAARRATPRRSSTP